MIRYMFLPLLVIILYDTTYVLISFYFGVNFLYLAYILCLQPFVSLILFIQTAVIEIGTMVAISGALLLYSDEIEGKIDYSDKMFNGWLIYYGNFVVIIAVFFTYIWNILVLICEKSTEFLAHREKNKVHNSPV